MATTPKRAAVQAAVLEATEALLSEGTSWADLGVERIARAAGISRTAFYFYFKDKRELLMRLTEAVADGLYAEAEAWFGGGGEELEGALRKVGDLYAEHAVLLRVIVEVSTYDEEVARFWRELLGRFVEATRARLEADEADVEDPYGTAFALVWMTERAFYQQLVQGEPVADLAGALARIWSRAVGG
jgi:TetR/AcrR family transcriptional regulator, ethionamide resistance regulator